MKLLGMLTMPRHCKVFGISMSKILVTWCMPWPTIAIFHLMDDSVAAPPMTSRTTEKFWSNKGRRFC